MVPRSTCGQLAGGVGSISGRFRVDAGSTRGRCVADMQSCCGRSGVCTCGARPPRRGHPQRRVAGCKEAGSGASNGPLAAEEGRGQSLRGRRLAAVIGVAAAATAGAVRGTRRPRLGVATLAAARGMLAFVSTSVQATRVTRHVSNDGGRQRKR